MGSLEGAVKTGFMCRLCSEMHKHVILIYSNRGIEMNLANKINNNLPVTIDPNDPLPKTICTACIQQLDATCKLITQLQTVRQILGMKDQSKPENERCDTVHYLNNAALASELDSESSASSGSSESSESETEISISD